MGQGFVKPGVCLGRDGVTVCALDSTTCKTDATFLSSQELAVLRPNRKACEIREQMIGFCDEGGSFSLCTSTADGCQNPQSFRPQTSHQCTVGTTSQPEARFGSCKEEDGETQCLWSRSECTNGIWISAHDATTTLGDGGLAPCTCEHVRTGACVTKSADGSLQFSCSVSAQACSNESDYWGPQQLGTSAYTCHLCQPDDGAVPPTRSPTASTTISTAQPPLLPPTSSSSSSSRQRDRNYITISVGCSVGVLMVGFLMYRMLKKPALPPLLNEATSRPEMPSIDDLDDMSSLSSRSSTVASKKETCSSFA